MISISVFVCTYNPRADLLLEVLVNVGESTKVACEDVIVDSLVVVDNNSKSESSEMIKRLCENHGFDYVLETKQGLTHARLCAISQNRAIGFYLWMTTTFLRLTSFVNLVVSSKSDQTLVH